jgi:hypothetical protein
VDEAGAGKGLRESVFFDFLAPTSGLFLSSCVRGRFLCLEGVGEGFVVVVVVVYNRTIMNVQAVVAVVAVAAAPAAVLQCAKQGCISFFCVSVLVVGEVVSGVALRASASCCLLGGGSLVSFSPFGCEGGGCVWRVWGRAWWLWLRLPHSEQSGTSSPLFWLLLLQLLLLCCREVLRTPSLLQF